MRVPFFTILFFILISFVGFSQQNFEKAVQQLLEKPEYKNASVGIQIVNLNSGESIYGLNNETLLVPASVMKLVTSAAALELLGSDYRFKTKVGYEGTITKNKTLNGNLILIGGGDPALGSEYFKDNYSEYYFLDNWVQKIKAAGIQKVNGDIILDGSIYDSEKVPDTWIWGDIGNYYGAGSNAFTVYDNMFRITFKSPQKAGQQTEIIATSPKIEGMEITNEVVSSDINSDEAYIFGSPLDKIRTIRGTIPKNRSAFTIKGAVHQPQELLARDLLSQLAKEGIFISGEIRFQKTDINNFKSIYIQESPTLAEIAKVLNHESVNLFAEHLVRQIAAEKTGVGSRVKGIEIIKEFWNSKGIQSETFFMEDGSGLSHFNAISASHLTSVLNYMFNQSENKEVFYNSLPAAGSGTISGFRTEYFPGNTLKAKSGSMTLVRCYAGYLELDSGNKVAFSIMVNHFSGSHSKLINEIENLLYQLKHS